ncbi:hypothetical protein [Larsenimonas suaedae]|uniref:Uncharacterized protein n=1 Tax=Larsenimonas suaedae TaxID=1851019 RepID=A0ABU1GVV8_9GAMM|nr:hypothetical protein [Larsenimonas suaedae]MCM2973289.1 hypothetical protein [Larsenimonas suaedae]MDR5896182.1 hypothetical protein [Larsenimonas suaedae]
MAPSSNFEFLAEHDPLLVELATAAECSFSSDPNTTLIKLRQLGEAIAQHIAALSGIAFDGQTSQADLLYRLNRELRLEPQVNELFHTLRIARELAIWFHQPSGSADTRFKPCPFVAPAVSISRQTVSSEERI